MNRRGYLNDNDGYDNDDDGFHCGKDAPAVCGYNLKVFFDRLLMYITWMISTRSVHLHFSG